MSFKIQSKFQNTIEIPILQEETNNFSITQKKYPKYQHNMVNKTEPKKSDLLIQEIIFDIKKNKFVLKTRSDLQQK